MEKKMETTGSAQDLNFFKQKRRARRPEESGWTRDQGLRGTVHPHVFSHQTAKCTRLEMETSLPERFCPQHCGVHSYPDSWADLESRTPLRASRN